MFTGQKPFEKIKTNIYKSRDMLRRVIGRWLFDRPLKGDGQLDLASCKRVLLIRWDAKIGDAIVSSFLFRELRKSNPSLSIEVVATSTLADMFLNQWHADRLYLCQKRPSYKELKKLAQEIGFIDLAIHFNKQFKMRDLFFVNRLNPFYLASLDDELLCSNIKLKSVCQGLHFSQKFAKILSICGQSAIDTRYWVPCSNQSELAVAESWPDDNAGVIAINPFGASNSRRLSQSSIIGMIAIFRKMAPTYRLCLLYTPTERLVIESVLAKCADPFVFIYQKSESVYDVIAQLHHCIGLVSVDTATIHIATGIKIPLLGLYNPDMENYADWGPNNPESVTVFSNNVKPYNINNFDWEAIESGIAEFLERVTARHVACKNVY